MAQYVRKDHFYKKAKEEGYRSRAAYKLKELVTRYKLIRKGERVLDLGCAPGGFLQVAAEFTGDDGRIAGADLLAVTPLPQIKNLLILRGDCRDKSTQQKLFDFLGGPADCVMSDMAPNTTGIHVTDHAGSIALARTALDVASTMLRPGGRFVVKLFNGEDLNDYEALVKTLFDTVEITRPEATRKGSIELYLVARGRKTPKKADPKDTLTATATPAHANTAHIGTSPLSEHHP